MEKIIEIKDLTYTYPNQTKAALQNLSLTVKRGAWVALIGHNGSGKSTLAKLLNHLLTPSAGQILIDQIPVDDDHVNAIRNRVGMVFQNPDNQFVGATVADDVAFGLENRQMPYVQMQERVKTVLEEVHMWEFAKREPGHLSGGQKQRVAIASALAIKPQILILDEATAMLDPKGRFEIMEEVRQLKADLDSDLTVISITHDIDEAASADQVIVLNDGQLVETGAPAEIFTDAQKLQALGLGVPFAEQLKAKLAAQGVAVPAQYETMEGMAEWIWQLISKK
ncbi:energy-coupling factor ABC transporter ATP-binding protein [Weissella kandleri]|uniref:energy-coupling factor ABC transporter ATP-binding protein n=1 Tax=Weissella kandleri TaxID=1616 RepID=UPI00387ED16D